MSARTSATLRAFPWLAVTALLLILLAGGWLRWVYLRTISLHVDEFTTLWAARQVEMHGLPRMPSGVLYTRGLLASYVEAAALWLGGFSFTVGRLPSLLIGLATIAALYGAGRRGWRTAVGLLAALGLALLPEAIVWSGRARFYAQFQLLTLLALWAAWEAILPHRPHRSDREPWTPHLRFATLFVLALFSQEQAILLYPSLLLAFVIWGGARRLLRPPVLAAHAIILVAMGARFAIEIAGQPGYFETIQASRPYIGWVFDLRGAWATYSPLLMAWERLPWTIGALVAVGAAAAAFKRTQGLRALDRGHQSTLFYALHLGSVLLLIFLLVGTSWREARYLFFVQPLWLLLGAAGFGWLLGLVQSKRARLAASAGAAVLLALITMPAALDATTQQVEGFDKLLSRVRAERLPGDAVLSPQPPACALILDRCDGYAIQHGYEEFVIERNGQLVDRWTGSPLVSTTDQLLEIIRTTPRTWFVSDSFRLATRYDADFLHTLVTQFDLVAQQQGVLALRAAGERAVPALTVREPLTPSLRFGPLALVEWARSDPNPGQPLTVELRWTGAEPIDTQINTSVRIVDAAGNVIAQKDGPPANGIIPTTLFFDTPLSDIKQLELPEGMELDRYRIDVAAYAVTQEGAVPQGAIAPIDWFKLGTTQVPLMPPLGAWKNGIVLLGAWGEQEGNPVIATTGAPGRVAPGEPLRLQVSWGTTRPVATPLTAFVHLIGPDGAVMAQDDHPPEGGFYPTDRWDVPEHIWDSFSLHVPEQLPPGTYRLITGWYGADGVRVPVEGGSDAIELAVWNE